MTQPLPKIWEGEVRTQETAQFEKLLRLSGSRDSTLRGFIPAVPASPAIPARSASAKPHISPTRFSKPRNDGAHTKFQASVKLALTLVVSSERCQ